MIRMKICNGNRNTEISLPCKDNEMQYALKLIRADMEMSPQPFVQEIIHPAALSLLEGRFVNLDELNYLAKRMESFDKHELDRFYAAAMYEEYADPIDLINLTITLRGYTLVQDMSDMDAVGRHHMMTIEGGISQEEMEQTDYAAIGRELVFSGNGIPTLFGMLYKNKDVETEKPYDGQVFPYYCYSGDCLLTATLEYHGKTEYVYLPDDALAIQKALNRLGASYCEDCRITLEDLNIENAEWFERFNSILRSEDLYEVNELCKAINQADMDLEKLSAIIRYADADNAVQMVRLAENMELFVYVPNSSEYENIGRHFVRMNPEYQIHPDLAGYFDFEKYGKAIAESHDGDFLEGGGYVCIEDGHSLEEILDIDESMKMGGM